MNRAHKRDIRSGYRAEIGGGKKKKKEERQIRAEGKELNTCRTKRSLDDGTGGADRRGRKEGGLTKNKCGETLVNEIILGEGKKNRKNRASKLGPGKRSKLRISYIKVDASEKGY